MSNKQYDFLDIIALASFVVGMANYEENVGQTQVNDLVKGEPPADMQARYDWVHSEMIEKATDIEIMQNMFMKQ